METKKMKQRIKAHIEIDQIKYAFSQAKDKLLSEADALQINMTEVFWNTLKDKIDHGELINLACRGEVRTGKSTTIIKIAYEINKHIEKKKLNKNLTSNMSKYIFSDQTEFLRFINEERHHIAIVIDEFNKMAKTGLNATTEEALFDAYSDVFAAQYIHRVAASPGMIADNNANIILDVIGKDEKQKVVRTKLTYRDVTTQQQMCIGYVDIYVGDIIEIWDKHIKNIYTKNTRTPEDIKKIEKHKETDFYVRYQIKKYKRMDLLKKHGVRDIREPEYAQIILDALREMQDLAKVGKVTREIIITVIDEIRRRHKRIYSMLALQEIATKTSAILSIYTEINKMHKKSKGGIRSRPSPGEILIYDTTIKQLKDMLKKRMEEQEQLATLYRQYIKIE